LPKILGSVINTPNYPPPLEQYNKKAEKKNWKTMMMCIETWFNISWCLVSEEAFFSNQEFFSQA
jgi:hypothetical protein